MSKILYLECSAGISGDMSVAAMLDLGADEKVLREVLRSLPLSGYEIAISRVEKSGLDCCDFNVILEEDNHDHDMGYLHGNHEHTHDHSHIHAHDHTHSHEHNHDYAHEHSHDHGHSHSHEHAHRNLKDIYDIIDAGTMTDGARVLSKRIFYVIAEAESKAHGKPIDEVHFHEVGAVDSIVDIVAFAVCYDNLGYTDTIIPSICEGQGTVRCQHGVLPIPVPAVTNIMSQSDLNMEFIPVQGEFITPTGAAIAGAIMTSDRLPKKMRIRKVGLGAGKRNYERASILRAMEIESSSDENTDSIWKLETNIDDCSGENLGYVMDVLLKAGARDVHYTPCFMKKNRPAWQLNVICDENHVATMEEIIFRETTTIGIRRMRMERTVLTRRQEVITTPFGDARVKICENDKLTRYYPEYDDVIKLCQESGRSYSEVYQSILIEANEFNK